MPWIQTSRPCRLPLSRKRPPNPIDSRPVRASPSERVATIVCLGFALWTLCAHLVVWAGGSLSTLMLLFAAVGAGVLFVQRRLRRDGEVSAPARSSEPDLQTEPLLHRAIALAVATAAAGTALLRGDPITTWILWVIVLGAAAGVWVLRRPASVEAADTSRDSEAALWILAGVCVLYALCVHRPNADDAFYVNLAVGALDHPELPLLARDTLHGQFDLPIHYPTYRLHSFELWNAGLSRIAGLSPLATFHFVSTALGAMLVPIAHAVLFRRLTPRCWIWTTVAVVIVLAAPGETHRWFGNFAFVRMWQGKAIFLCVFLPLVYAYALDFATRGDRASWLRLAAALIASLGCTSSAIWAGPIAALVAMSCALRPVPADLRRLALGALACLYPVATGLAVKSDMTGAIPELAQSFAPGVQLEAALATVLGDARLHVVGVFALFAAWAVCPPGLARRFAITAPLAAALVLLNPWTDAWVRANVSGPYFWRVMWAIPVPTLIALLLVGPLSLGVGTPRLRAALCVVLMIAFAVGVPRYPGFDARNAKARLGWPSLKVPDAYRMAQRMNEIAGGRRVVAPNPVATWIPVERDHAYPLIVRMYLKPQRERIGEIAYRDRLLMRRFAGGVARDPRAAAIFERGLELFDVYAVCLRAGSAASQARAILRRSGFTKRIQDSRFEIWAR
jgi:hypothetical protein